MKPITHFRKVRLVEMPSVRQTPGGTSVCEVGVGYNEKYKNKAGKYVENAYFYRLQFWGQSADFLQKYGTKGSAINADATPVPSSWEDKDGKKCYKLVFKVSEFEFCESHGTKRSQVADAGRDQSNDGGEFTPDSFGAGDDDQLPF